MVGPCKVAKQNKELFIALTHEDHKHIIFDRVLRAGNSVLLAAKMVIRNPEDTNAVIVNGKQSKEYFHKVTGHAGHHLMDATAKYYKVNLTGTVNNCLSCSLEKIRQKNILKKNEDKSENPGERMYLDISSMRKPVLLAAKMVIRNPEDTNAVIVNGKQSKEYFHKVTGHAGHHLMDATAKYYKVNLTGTVNNCLSCSLEKTRQKNILKKNEDKSENPGERMYLDISSMRKPSMGGRQHWVMLVDEATKYKKSFFLKKKNEQVQPIFDWIKALKARHAIQ